MPARFPKTAACGLLWLACGACSVLFEPGHAAKAGDAATGDADADAATGGNCDDTTIKLDDIANDGEIDGSDFLPNGEPVETASEIAGIYMGAWNDSPTWGYFRFLIPASPRMMTIKSAELSLWGTDIAIWDASQDALRIHVENTADSLPVTSAGQAPRATDATPVLDETIRWPSAGGLGWKTGEYNVSPDLIAPLQSLYSKHPDQSAERHITFWIRGDFEDGSREVIANDLFVDNAHPTQLRITYCN